VLHDVQAVLFALYRRPKIGQRGHSQPDGFLIRIAYLPRREKMDIVTDTPGTIFPRCVVAILPEHNLKID